VQRGRVKQLRVGGLTSWLTMVVRPDDQIAAGHHHGGDVLRDLDLVALLG
jgi:acyl-CoA hydrolase